MVAARLFRLLSYFPGKRNGLGQMPSAHQRLFPVHDYSIDILVLSEYTPAAKKQRLVKFDPGIKSS